MRKMLMSGALVGVAALAFAGSILPASAEIVYPWCARYGGTDYGGAENCGFSTREQCMATISGIGGHCQMNVNWPPSAPEPRIGRHKAPARS